MTVWVCLGWLATVTCILFLAMLLDNAAGQIRVLKQRMRDVEEHQKILVRDLSKLCNRLGEIPPGGY